MSEGKDPVIETVMDFLNANGPSELEGKWYHGEVLLPAEGEIPLGYITKTETEITPADNMEDDHLIDMQATIILDFTDDLNNSYEMVAGMAKLYDWMEGRDEEYRLKTTSILYHLRTSQQIKPKFWIGVGSTTRVRYGLGIQRRGPGIFSVEATVYFRVRLALPNPEFY